MKELLSIIYVKEREYLLRKVLNITKEILRAVEKMVMVNGNAWKLDNSIKAFSRIIKERESEHVSKTDYYTGDFLVKINQMVQENT